MSKDKPEDGMSPADGQAVAAGVADRLEDLGGNPLADFVLFLRWAAYGAKADDLEDVYIAVEKQFAVNFDGVEATICAHMRKRVAAYKGRRPKKGGKP
jgi:hypothetical protein